MIPSSGTKRYAKEKLTEDRVAEGANAEAQPQIAIGISDLDSMVGIVLTIRQKDSIYGARNAAVLLCSLMSEMDLHAGTSSRVSRVQPRAAARLLRNSGALMIHSPTFVPLD